MTAQSDPSSWPERTFYAMGSQMSARLAVAPHLAASPLAQVEKLFHDAEDALSRFRTHSELSYLNAHPDRWVRLSPRLWNLITTALKMAEQTGGLFDPTLLHALEAAGYRRSFDQMRANATCHAQAQRDPLPSGIAWRGGGYRRLRLRRATRELWLPSSLKLDLGGIAKGYLAQEAVAYLRPWGAALVDAGGDLVAGDAPPGCPGWPVAVAAPSTLPQGGDADVAMVWLVNAALATSGIDYRQWQANGRRMHHIIDPRSGEPATTDLLSATVLASTAAEAECWAKSAIILGEQQAASALARRGFAALLVRRDGYIVTTPTAPHPEGPPASYQQQVDGPNEFIHLLTNPNREVDLSRLSRGTDD